MIDQKRLKELIKLMVANDLTELDLQSKDERVTLKRGAAGESVQRVQALPAPAPAAEAPVVAAAAAESADGSADVAAIRSPMVGTFYAAPSPDAKPFVSAGDVVEPDSVVCIIEAMKVFNEIKAETAGVIDKVLVDNGHAVEFDEPLFQIK
jgi:acetyl-CoA carboxylase biotin carboxyl carrier protein